MESIAIPQDSVRTRTYADLYDGEDPNPAVVVMKSLLPFLLFVVLTHPTLAQDDHASHDHGTAPENWIPESVNIQATATAEAHQYLNRGVEALHNFWYDASREAFQEAQRIEPDLVLAYWGEAFSHQNPFGFSGGDREAMAAVLVRLAPTPEERQARAKTEREARWMAAMELLASEGTQENRRRSFSNAMRELAEDYPTDLEAWAFYAISIFGTEQNIRGVPAAREEAARAARHVLAASPRHPGALHYAIHALDTPDTAHEVLDAAETYTTVSTDASHAIHMPSHIFMQVGMWDRAIEVNLRAWAASEAWAEKADLGSTDRDWHAADFLHYSLLQKGQFESAGTWVHRVRNLDTDDWQPDWYGPLWEARQRVERDEWGEAPPPETRFNIRDVVLIQGLDGARRGDQEAARKALAVADERISASEGSGNSAFPAPRWQVVAAEIQAVIAHAEVDMGEAERAMERAFEAFGELPPPNETPDPAKPPYELWGDLLFATGQYADAAGAYRHQLELRQGRARSLIGLARASEQAGDMASAEEAWRAVLNQWGEADSGIPEVAEGRRFLAGR